MIVVKLDDPQFGAGPGTVVATVDTVADYIALVTDRDGAVDPSMRLWHGSNLSIGSRVVAKQPEDPCPACGKDRSRMSPMIRDFHPKAC